MTVCKDGVPNLHNRHCIIVENCGYVFRGKLVGCVGDQEAGLSNSTIANHDTPNERRSLSQFRVHCMTSEDVDVDVMETYLIVATTMMTHLR